MSAFPEIEKYGREASFSLLADLLELDALQRTNGYSRSIYDLADFIRDAGLTNKLGDLWEEEERQELDVYEDDLSLSSQSELANQVYDFIDERMRLLESAYPFEIRNDSVFINQSTLSSEAHNYLSLLDITVSHAFGERTFEGENPRDKFEIVCVTAMAGLGYRTAGMMSQQSASNFESRLLSAEKTLQTAAFSASAIIRRTRQQDAKADLLAIHDLGDDDRHCRHLWVGQATCAKSEQWSKKRNEVSCERWKKLSREKLSPVSTLMIPHHADPTHLTELAQDHSPPIFDRLRLCSIASSQFPGEFASLLDNFSRFRITGWGLER